MVAVPVDTGGGGGAGDAAETVRRAGTSFYWAMRLLPRDKRDAMYAVYAFCRAVDDIADGPGPASAKRRALAAWRETPFFTDRERAALAWAEALTAIADEGAPDDLYEEAREQLEESELVALTFAVITINSWNRLAIAFRAEPGSYRVAA